MKNYLKSVTVLIFFMAVLFLPVQADSLSDYRVAASTAATTEISLETALHRILDNNLTAGILKYEAKQADSDYERYQTKFSPFINASAGHQNNDFNLSGLSPQLNAMYGAQFSVNEATLNLGQTFKTGTTVIGGYKYSNVDFSELPGVMTGYSSLWSNPTAYIQIKQDLLKNCFGYTDRLQDDILKNMRDSKQVATEYQLSGLMVSGIFDYWSVAEDQKKLSAAESELIAYKKIYKAVSDNVAFGLFEKYNLYQFNALISGSEAKLAAAQLNYRKSAHKMLRNLNMPDAGGDSLSLVSIDDSLHTFDAAALYAKALGKRADIRQAKLALDSAEKQLQILNNQDLPDAQLQLQGADERLGQVNAGTGDIKYSNWEAKLSVTKVLFDTDNSIQRRNARYQRAQANLQLQNLKNQVKDEVQDGVAGVQTAYVGVEKTKDMVKDSQLYLDALLVRLKQGKISSVELKAAVDMMVVANNSNAEAVTGYNMALLNLDLVTNTVFEKYHLNISSIVKETK